MRLFLLSFKSIKEKWQIEPKSLIFYKKKKKTISEVSLGTIWLLGHLTHLFSQHPSSAQNVPDLKSSSRQFKKISRLI